MIRLVEGLVDHARKASVLIQAKCLMTELNKIAEFLLAGNLIPLANVLHLMYHFEGEVEL